MMELSIYIRPLELNDASTSYLWRNNPLVWKFTGGRPDRIITKELETDWLSGALKRENEYRFAICVKETDQYIGNAQLTHITDNSAQYHIFIGETELWGKGIGKQATALLLGYAFDELKLNSVFLEVNAEHKAAIKAYQKSGFVETKEPAVLNNFIRMEIKNSNPQVN